MSVIHHTTLAPTKLELLAAWLPAQPWYRHRGRQPELARVGGFRLDDPAGEVGIEFMAVSDGDAIYHVPMSYRGVARDGNGLIGTCEHGVLGRRWVYDGAQDPVLLAQLAALVRGEAEPQAQNVSHAADPTVLVHRLQGVADLHIRRVLRPDDGVGPDGVPEQPGVTATWESPDGTRVRGVYVSAL